MLRIDKMTHQRQMRLNQIVDLLDTAQMGESGHDSTQQPFFLKGETHDFVPGQTQLPELPDGLNRNFRDMYEIICNPDVEVTIQTTDEFSEQWTIMSANKAKEIFDDYKSGGQESVFDIAYTYMGLGHINVLSCDLHTHNLFVHEDGGSNGWERQSNREKILNYNREHYQQFYFTDFLKKFQ